MDNTIFLYIYTALAITFSGLHVAYMLRRDTYATEKYMTVMSIMTYMAATILCVLALFYLYLDKTYLQQVLLGVIMIVCLPATLISVSVATITGSN